jgi:hypothetical protein
METATMTDAERVADDHLAALVEWETALDTFGVVTPDDLDDQAGEGSFYDDDDRALAARMAARLRDDGYDELSWSSFVGEALDVEITGTFSGGCWSVSGVALLVTAGGPNVRYHVAGDSIRIEVAWWNDRATRYVTCGLADYLDTLADDLAAGAS